MNQPYIFESSKNTELSGNEAIIVLPDIYCQTDYSKRTTEEFAQAFGKPVFMLDYFSIYTKQANSFTENDRESVHALMENFKGDEFVTFFQNALVEIKKAYPSVTQFIVIGFCFGGRLAYIAGGEKEVSKVFSFYGGGAHTPDYVQNKTAIEYLVSKRSGDLQVDSFFGLNDPSIPEEDRRKTKEELTKAGVSYEAHEYNAGHAYFQEGRKNYDSAASQSSWEVLKQKML